MNLFNTADLLAFRPSIGCLVRCDHIKLRGRKDAQPIAVATLANADVFACDCKDAERRL